MSAPSLGQQEIKALEQTRQRLSQLTHSLSSMQQRILQSDPLPPWSSLQSLAAIISQNLASVSQQLKTHHELFASMSVYPTHEFPGQTQEDVLGQLLRKKLEPNVQDWAAEARKIATEQTSSSGLEQSEFQELWSWAGLAANEQARKHTWGGNYTLDEIDMGVENVVTGLRRKLKVDPDESSDDEDEEETAVEGGGDDDEMEIVGVRRKSTGEGLEFDLAKGSAHPAPEVASTALPINSTFRFLMTGAAPPAG
ncbi:mediator of RNA polymerase II transcription subunit 8 [Trapelia coarctata]|nr:mediator of RNA polymerase II transcription subunit 8 [Trapelia coarctata]